MSSGQCRLAPLIQVIQDCSHLYHYTVKLMFKLHSCESLHGPRGSRSPRVAFMGPVSSGVYRLTRENGKLVQGEQQEAPDSPACV